MEINSIEKNKTGSILPVRFPEGSFSSKLAKERLIFIKLQNIPHLKFLCVSINSVKLNIVTISTIAKFRAQMKVEAVWEREQLYYTEIKF